MKIPIKGVIVPNDDKWVYDWLDIEAVSPRDVLSNIEKANGEPLDVTISSGGGDVYAGVEIYDALRSYKGLAHIHVINAGSAASVIACARESDITPAGTFMLHKVSIGGASGNSNDMEHLSDVLKAHDRAIAGAYTEKTGMPLNKILEYMEKETYLSAQEALELGFVNSVAERQLVASTLSASLVPPETIAKLKNLVKNPAIQGRDILTPEKARAKLNLLKLGGNHE